MLDTPFLGVDRWLKRVEDLLHRVEYDLHTIRNWSLALDLKIVALTLVRGFAGAGAY